MDHVPNSDGSLIPGMYAEVHLGLATHPNVMTVPVDAVDGLGTTVQHVYVVRGDVLHLATVTVGLQTPSQVEILSGVQNGDQVVVGRRTGLSDGEKVTPRPAKYESDGNGHS